MKSVFFEDHKAQNTASYQKVTVKYEYQTRITGKPLRWIGNNLHKEVRKTHVREVVLNWRTVTKGVPQG